MNEEQVKKQGDGKAMLDAIILYNESKISFQQLELVHTACTGFMMLPKLKHEIQAFKEK